MLSCFLKRDERYPDERSQYHVTPRDLDRAARQHLKEAIRRMLQNHVSGVPVIRAGLVGVVAEGYFLRRRETCTVRGGSTGRTGDA
jgi:CBS domain-containing protein